MPLTRFSVSLDEELMNKFDAKIKKDRCPTRSKAVGDLIRSSLVQTEWRSGDEVAGAIVLVYDHHTRDVGKRLTDMQHDCHDVIISTQMFTSTTTTAWRSSPCAGNRTRSTPSSSASNP